MTINNKPLRIGIIAGEHSGDILGAGLIKSIKSRYPNAIFEGIAGPRMKALGCNSLFDMEELAVMGLVEVFSRLLRLLSIKKQIVKYFIANPPDIFIGIDAPDFNLRVELPLKQAGIKTVQYVSPSVWAWREKRVFKIADATNMVLSLLPFEKAFYDKHQVPCTFVGHTLADDIALESHDLSIREKFGFAQTDKVLALLPGSRGTEIGLLSETYLKTAQKLKKEFPELKIVVPLVNEKRKLQFSEIWQQVAPELELLLLDGQSDLAMQSADVILLASGTATLEAMLYNKPMVVGYKIKPLSHLIFSSLFKFNIKYFSLPNLLADEALVPELFQKECIPENLFKELMPLLASDNTMLKNKFKSIHRAIRLNASEKAAEAVLKLCINNKEENHV